MGIGVAAPVSVISMRCLPVFSDLPLWFYVSYSYCSIYECSLINSYDLSVVVNLISVLDGNFDVLFSKLEYEREVCV